MLLDEWHAVKREEVRTLELRPHPAEFAMYHDL
jgi:glutamine synthetase